MTRKSFMIDIEEEVIRKVKVKSAILNINVSDYVQRVLENSTLDIANNFEYENVVKEIKELK